MASQLVSFISKTAKAVPKEYIYPKEWRSEKDVPFCHDVPVIDLSPAMGSDVHDRAKVADQVLKALEGGLGFQVINHGVSKKLLDDAVDIFIEFFNLPIEDKEKSIREWTNTRTAGLYSGSDDPSAEVLLWIETLFHHCHPLDYCNIDSWPDKPATYRKVISEYATETRKLCQSVFKLIAEGVGLEKQFFDNEKFIENKTLRGNYYPKSPDPSLTLGLPIHFDPNPITIIQQNFPGLQLHKDGKWVLLETLPHAFYFLPGMEFQIFSNGRFKAVLHQVGTNRDNARLSINNFMAYNKTHTTVKPYEAFITDENPPKYKEFSYEKYFKIIKNKKAEGGDGQSFVELCKYALDSFLLYKD